MSEVAPVDIVVRRSRAGEPVGDVELYAVQRALDDDAAGASDDRVALRALLAPGRRGTGFYLDDAFAEPLCAARAAYARAEAALVVQRDAIAAEVRAVCGVDAAADEFIVLRARYAGPLPASVVLVAETAGYRRARMRLDTAQRDAAFDALAQAESEARRALAAAIERVARGAAP